MDKTDIFLVKFDAKEPISRNLLAASAKPFDYCTVGLTPFLKYFAFSLLYLRSSLPLSTIAYG